MDFQNAHILNLISLFKYCVIKMEIKISPCGKVTKLHIFKIMNILDTAIELCTL
jgi:hypothetical protein